MLARKGKQVVGRLLSLEQTNLLGLSKDNAIKPQLQIAGRIQLDPRNDDKQAHRTSERHLLQNTVISPNLFRSLCGNFSEQSRDTFGDAKDMWGLQARLSGLT